LLSFFATVHQVNVDELMRELNDEMRNPSAQPYVYKETLPDYIYRRFFKALFPRAISMDQAH